MNDLHEEIETLINLRKEGDFWDFKREHHEGTADLVKDIICLANNTRHNGRRFLIYGVDDNSYDIVDVSNSPRRRTQANIIDALRALNFANQSWPDVSLQTIAIQEKNLDVVIIQDRPEKPYYVEVDKKDDKDKEQKSKSVTLRAGVVYSRVEDTNTPNDKSATPSDIEKMWRERFGLDQTPFERMQTFLNDPDGWVDLGNNRWYYSQFPEFTLSDTEDDGHEVTGGENWVRAAINPRAFVRPMVMKYHQTILREIVCIYFDEMREITPAPKPANIAKPSISDDLWFYYLCKDSFDYLLLSFFTAKRMCSAGDCGLCSARTGRMPVLFFSSLDEKEAFTKYLGGQQVSILENHKFVGVNNDPLVTPQDKRIIEYSRAVIDLYQAWKKKD